MGIHQGFRASGLKVPRLSFPSALVTISCGIILFGIGAIAQAQIPTTEQSPRDQAKSSQTVQSLPRQAQLAPTVLKLNWMDQGLIYVGYITSDFNMMRIDSITDRYNGRYVAANGLEASSTPIDNGYLLSGVIVVPRDSMTGYPHKHAFNLVVLTDGVSVVAENRVDGKRYPANIGQ